MKKIILTTSLYRLRKYRACSDRYAHLVDKLGPEWGDKDDINLLDILKHNGVADCLWALCAAVKHPEGTRVMRLMAADFAEAVRSIFERGYPDDKRPRLAIEAARKFANGEITDQEHAAEWAATWDTAAWGTPWATAGAASWAAQAKIIRKYLGRKPK